MFEIGFPELVLIAIVGLLVIGPERLPEALRTLGLWFGRMRRSFTTVKAEIEKEIGMDEVKRQLHNEAILEEMKRIEAEVKNTADSARSSINAGVQAAEGTATAAAADAAPTAPDADQPAAQDIAAPAVERAGPSAGDEQHADAGDDRDHGDAAEDERDHSDAAAAPPAPPKAPADEAHALDYAIGDVSPPPPAGPTDGNADPDDRKHPTERVTNG